MTNTGVGNVNCLYFAYNAAFAALQFLGFQVFHSNCTPDHSLYVTLCMMIKIAAQFVVAVSTDALAVYVASAQQVG